jgi:hypothetical protein
MPQATVKSDLLSDLLRDLTSARARVRLAASKALRDLSRNTPEAVYPHLDRLAALISHENSILQWNAILSLAYLAPVDREGKLDPLLPRYLEAISGPVMITAANTIKGAALIAAAKPHLAGEIAAGIMRTENGRYATSECRNVAIGHALQALEAIRAEVDNPAALRSFAVRHLNNSRQATARKAARLLASLGSASVSRSRS